MEHNTNKCYLLLYIHVQKPQSSIQRIIIRSSFSIKTKKVTQLVHIIQQHGFVFSKMNLMLLAIKKVNLFYHFLKNETVAVLFYSFLKHNAT
jgi:hypothetical protein